jgi:hypothetical protein
LAPHLRAAGAPVDLLQTDWNGADAMMIDEALGQALQVLRQLARHVLALAARTDPHA